MNQQMLLQFPQKNQLANNSPSSPNSYKVALPFRDFFR